MGITFSVFHLMLRPGKMLPAPSTQNVNIRALLNVTLVSAEWFVFCKCFVW